VLAAFTLPLVALAGDARWAGAGAGLFVQWLVGPTNVALGRHAELRVPEGFAFAGPADARRLLLEIRNPAPATLVGLLTPLSGTGRGLVVFRYAEIGHVRAPSAPQLDSGAVLARLRQELQLQNQISAARGGEAVEGLEWALEPRYQPAPPTLEWAVTGRTREATPVNHVVRLLSRRGILDAVAVYPGGSEPAPAPLRTLMEGVTFRPGEAYEDHEWRDPVVRAGLADLIRLDEIQSAAAAPVWMSWAVWAAVGAGALVLCAVGAVAFRRGQAVAAAGIPAEGALSEGAPPPVRGLPRLVSGWRRHRRRAFDHQRYYADLIAQVSTLSHVKLGSPASSASRASEESGHREPGASIPNGHLDLAAVQESLIAEQQQLIQEQFRLIEQQARLIQQRNQLIKLRGD
jgi:uncharacterized membrane-anchored protein